MFEMARPRGHSGSVMACRRLELYQRSMSSPTCSRTLCVGAQRLLRSCGGRLDKPDLRRRRTGGPGRPRPRKQVDIVNWFYKEIRPCFIHARLRLRRVANLVGARSPNSPFVMQRLVGLGLPRLLQRSVCALADAAVPGRLVYSA